MDMTRIFLALAMAGFAAGPALAMDDMTCADYMAMDAAGQAETVSMMEGSMGAMDSAMDSAGGMMASSDAMMAPEDTAMEVASACEGHPEMMVGAAIEGMMHQ
jgi:hypothetical protein